MRQPTGGDNSTTIIHDDDDDDDDDDDGSDCGCGSLLLCGENETATKIEQYATGCKTYQNMGSHATAMIRIGYNISIMTS